MSETATTPVRLAPGDPAPDFTLPDADGNPVSLSSYRGRRVIVYCYPAALTPGCTTQAVDFTAAAGDLAEAGVDIVGVSPDAPEKLQRIREKENLGITLVSDQDKQVLTSYGAYGPKKLYGKEVVGVIRSTFVVDAEGRIEKAAYNVKATGHVAKLRKDLGITLVSDEDKSVLTSYGAYGPKKLYGKEVVGVIRSTFVVDAEGRIEKAQYNVKATGHVAKLRKDLGLG